MSASAVRGGQVYVEIGANPSKLLNALRVVNTQVGNLGNAVASVGGRMAMAGTAITAPIAAAAIAFAGQNAEILKAQEALKGVGAAVGEAVAPAFVGMAKIVTGAATAVQRFIRDNQQLVRMALTLGGALLGVGSVLVGVGNAISFVTGVVGSAVAPIAGLARILGAVGAALVTIATSGPVLALAAVLGGVALGARAAGVDLGALASQIGTSLSGPLSGAIGLFTDLGATASTTVAGIYNAIAAGDLGTAVDIMWAGVQAGFARGSQAVMGALDPWIETVQNAFSDFGVGLAMLWDQTWTNIATSEWGGYVLGAMDNVLNGIMATWDNTIGYLQKGWARFSGWWSGDTAKMEAEIARIDAANADNAAQRGRDRPGFAGRTGLTDEQKAKMQQESRDRQAAMQAEADKMRADRASRTQANVQQRAQAVADANNRLQEKVGATQAPPPVDPNANASKIKTEIVGTFSAFGIDQMGSGNVQKQQLDALLKIQAGIDQANRVGGIIA